MNYFELFSLPVEYCIVQSELSATYRLLQKQFHPDNFVMQSDAQKRVAMQKSTEINDAYQTLKDNCLRAQYILLLQGLDIELDQRTLQDTDFLMQQMRWREDIESFTKDDEDAIEVFSNNIQDHIKALENTIELQLQKEALQATADSIRRLKFMLKLQTELSLIEETFFD